MLLCWSRYAFRLGWLSRIINKTETDRKESKSSDVPVYAGPCSKSVQEYFRDCGLAGGTGIHRRGRWRVESKVNEVTELCKNGHTRSDQRSALFSNQQMSKNLQKNLVSKYFAIYISDFFFNYYYFGGSMFVFNNSQWIFLLHLSLLAIPFTLVYFGKLFFVEITKFVNSNILANSYYCFIFSFFIFLLE